MRKKGRFFITGWNITTNQFEYSIVYQNKVKAMGEFSEGLNEQELAILVSLIQKNGKKVNQVKYSISPSICIQLCFRDIIEDTLSLPQFMQFLPNEQWETCTWERLLIENANIDSSIEVTHPEKPLWDNPKINKEQLIAYLVSVAPRLLPFVKNRLLTTIRYPHGYIGKEFFYQKNKPDYAPSFVNSFTKDEIDYILCNDLSTLVWLGNQLALEYHTPFETIGSDHPVDIVFDLDPPDETHFLLAVDAAQKLSKIFEELNIICFPKLTGGKGIQVHIPIMHHHFSYEDTRLFTSFIASYLVEKNPDLFTTERMKKNRGKKLYIDYIQHAEGKTMIAPYSPRGREGAIVAAPLYWDEVNKQLQRENFSLDNIRKYRLTDCCPMATFFETKNDTIAKIIDSLKE
ncbi:DNA ligase D [Cytobacillus kochii]|uniref:DNA ligase D n=1 Tax=Cytobacillus kochii TaxID=859143 RepID=UPI00203CF04F|nr:DNA ligase D [Cytobacillus kochii]MCM3320979.1 DNA ligase D [Cytobacillus kochii]MCM3344188.1 DNA ligase D [Cytobacillus kochii]